jgi:hypothetical protein
MPFSSKSTTEDLTGLTNVFSLEVLRIEDWKNKQLINELNNFVDTSRNYGLEEQINEIKDINITQNKIMEVIDEKLI